MFNIFKRPESNSNKCPQSEKNDAKRHSISLSTTSSSINEESLNDEMYDINEEEPFFECSSRLSMDFNAIINEQSCLIYFVQFLESKKSLPMIKFYLDTENFKTASENGKKCTNKNENCFCSFCDYTRTDFRITEDHQHRPFQDLKLDEKHSDTTLNKKEETNNLPSSKAPYDLSMQKSLTDDEKSQIYAENNKKQKCQQPENTMNTCRTTDAISIYKKYFIPNSAHYVSLPVSILSEISLVLCSDERHSCQCQQISTNLFTNAQNYVREKLEQNYLNEFLQSDLYCRYCIEFINSCEIKLNDILYSESALFYFLEYLEQENQRNYLDFWMAAINFRRHYENEAVSDSIREEAQSDAMILYEKYFSLQANCPLRIPINIRSIVEESICSNEPMTKISRCFDRPLKIIQHYLEREFFPNFLQSQLYSKFVVELHSKLNDHNRMDVATTSNQAAIPRITKHRKTMSDCTNKKTKDLQKHFISQHNTLLAMESHSSTLSRNKRSMPSTSNSSPDMQIDSRHFVDPDMLWQRNLVNSGNTLKFGRVNSLGRYERDFEFCPSTSKNWSLSGIGSSRIKNVARKWVNIPEDKIQEEIAWQVAEMIIDDVLSITMNRKLSSSKSFKFE